MNEVIVIDDVKTEVIQKPEFDLTREKLVNALSMFGMDSMEGKVKEQFIEICLAMKLNPFKREVYAVPFKGSHQIVVGYQTYVKRAELTGRLDGWNSELVGMGKEMKCVITIHRKDWKHPFKYEAFAMEFYKDTPIWREKPRLMLMKCAIGNAFRLCFPSEFAGMPYMAEEMEDKPRQEYIEQPKKEEIKQVSPQVVEEPQINQVLPQETKIEPPEASQQPIAQKPIGDFNKALKFIRAELDVDVLTKWMNDLPTRTWEEGQEKMLADTIVRRQQEIIEKRVSRVLK